MIERRNILSGRKTLIWHKKNEDRTKDKRKTQFQVNGKLNK